MRHGLDQTRYRRSGAGGDARKRVAAAKAQAEAKELEGYLLTLISQATCR